jgi:hypothetical protein
MKGELTFFSLVNSVVVSQKLNGSLNEDGLHYVQILFKGNPEISGVVAITALIEVTDLNNQILRQTLNFLLLPSPLMVGIRLEKDTIAADEGVDVELVVCNQSE